MRRDLGCNTSEPVAAGLPLPAPALRRFGSTEDAHPGPSRRDHTTHAGRGVCRCPQPSSAAVSAVVVGAILTDDRDHPHTAFVLTWLKIEERQTFAGRSLYAPKCLCSKGFRLRQAADPLEISLEIRRKQTDLPRGGLRSPERPMIKRRAFHIWQSQSKT